MNSMFLKLGLWDLAKGAVVFALTAVLTSIYPIVQSGGLPTIDQLKAIGLSALAAFIAYLLKNLFTNSAGTPGPEKPPVP